MLRFIVSVALLVAAIAHGQPAGNGSIGGVVVDHATGTPVRKAVVNVMWQGTPQAWASVQTDGSGRFQVDGLPAGSYTVQASKEGNGNGNWADTPGQMGKLLPLAAGERRGDLVVRLVRPVLITGTVTDADGEPIQGADVQLGREAWPRGTRELMQTGGARTNDRGEYRLTVFMPGKYYLSAGAAERRPGFSMQGEGLMAFPRQFHGGATDWKKATPMVLQSGQQLKGIDFRLEEQRMGSIRGRVTNPPPMPDPQMVSPSSAGPPPRPPAMLMVQVSSDDGRQARHFFGGGVNPTDGTFQIPAVPPGSYLLTATVQNSDKPMWATQKVEVKGDVDGISLTLVPGVAIRGKLMVEGESPVPVTQMTVDLTTPLGRGMGPGALHATPSAEGVFAFEQVPPGVWDINVRPVPKGGFIKSMRLGEQDVLTEEMEIGSKVSGPLNIVVSSRGGKVTGELADGAGKDTKAVVMLAPEEKFRHVMSFYTMAQSQGDGRFELTGVTPGKYRLYALEPGMMGGDLRNPDMLAKLATDATVVEVAEGSAVKATPKLIRAARVQEVLQ